MPVTLGLMGGYRGLSRTSAAITGTRKTLSRKERVLSSNSLQVYKQLKWDAVFINPHTHTHWYSSRAVCARDMKHTLWLSAQCLHVSCVSLYLFVFYQDSCQSLLLFSDSSDCCRHLTSVCCYVVVRMFWVVFSVLIFKATWYFEILHMYQWQYVYCSGLW